MKKLGLLTFGVLLAACTDYVQQYEQDYKAEYGDAELFELRQNNSESNDSEDSSSSKESSDSKSSSSVNSSDSDGSSSSAKSSDSKSSSSSDPGSGSKPSSSETSSSSIKAYGTCAPEISTVSTGKSVKWKFDWDTTANNTPQAAKRMEATFEWFSEGGSPESGSLTAGWLGGWTTTYSSVGTKTATVEVTLPTYGTQTIECSPLLVNSNSTTIQCLSDDLWCSNKTSLRVSTGVDAGANESGYWYSYTDSEDGGESRIVWPGSNEEELTDDVLDVCQGLCGTAELNKGGLKYDPFVVTGFHIAGPFDKPVATDVSGWGGVCITYVSQIAPRLELRLGDSLDKAMGYAQPGVDLQKTSTAKDTCLRWTDFKQPSWAGQKKISGLDASAILASMEFKVQGGDGHKAYFNIMRLRKYPYWIADIAKPSWNFLNPDRDYGIMLDTLDGQYYKTRVVDGVTWMAENLNRDLGDTTSRCYNDSTKYCDEYGHLYTWDAAKAICPEGWRLPSKDELVNLCDGEQGSFERASMLRSTSGWNRSAAKATNETGFSAVAAGSLGPFEFEGIGESVIYWGAEDTADSVYSVLITDGLCYASNIAKTQFSIPIAVPVRCVKDK